MKYGLQVPAKRINLLSRLLKHKAIVFGYNKLRHKKLELLFNSDIDRQEAISSLLKFSIAAEKQ